MAGGAASFGQIAIAIRGLCSFLFWPYLTFEYCHPYAHYPEARMDQTADSRNRTRGKKLAL